MLLLTVAAVSFAATINVDVSVDVTKVIAETDPHYVCLGMDWWPENKCNWGICPWGNASVLNANFEDPTLRKIVSRMDGAYLRIGGSICDSVVYNFSEPATCTPFSPAPPQPGTWFHGGCLPQGQWDRLNAFTAATKANLIFAINANYNRSKTTGAWDNSNALALMQYTVKHNYTLYGFEYGNELGYNASVFAAGLHSLHSAIETAYAAAPHLPRPKIIAPDEIHWDTAFFSELIPLVSDIVHAVTWHEYPLGEGYQNPMLDIHVMDPTQHDGWFKTAQEAHQVTANLTGGKMRSWMGESGGAANSGHNGTSNRFMYAFWYVDSLGGLAAAGEAVFCRQTLIGGNYEMVDHRTNKPNPDYYGALMFSTLMGEKVLSASTDATYERDVRMWAHCTKGTTKNVTLLVFNFGNSTAQVNLQEDIVGTRLEYHMTAAFINATEVELNGHVMTVDTEIEPVEVASGPITLSNISYAFVVVQPKNSIC